MKTILAPLAPLAALVLAACATQPQTAPANWGYQPGQQAPRMISEAEAETLTAQVADMKAKRREIINSLPTATDPSVRAQRQNNINVITEQLQPLEYRLRAAGRPVPRD